ncbi:MAG: antitoxin Xre/MbcA/ParS toxin-binding domain-containing protein [Verrucomicrobiae bacterium]
MKRQSDLTFSGVPMEEVSSLRVREVAGGLQLEEEALALRCGLSRSTYYRRRQSKKPLSALEADLLDRHARILAQAREVFESSEAATRWLKTPQLGLGGGVPLDAIRSTSGFREVEKLLTRIDYGVYA